MQVNSSIISRTTTPIPATLTHLASNIVTNSPLASPETRSTIGAQQQNMSIEERIVIPLTEAPQTHFRRNGRIGTELINDHTFRIFDKQPDGVYHDVELVGVMVSRDVSYGEKTLEFDLAIKPSMIPAWGPKVFQVQLDGEELVPIGTALDRGSDGKGFVQPFNGHYRFIVPKEKTSAGIISFMTAGAEKYDVTVSNLSLTINPSTDPRPVKQTLLVNQAGYISASPKTAILELPRTMDGISHSFSILNATGSNVLSGKTKSNQYLATSGKTESIIDFSAITTPGTYTVSIAKQPGIPLPLQQKIIIGAKYREIYLPLMKKSLLAYNAFVCDPNGPFHDHSQDKSVAVLNSSETRDVSGGWHDAGDYNKYGVTGAWSVALMLLAHEYTPATLSQDIGKIYNKTPKRTDLLSITKHELEFLQKLQNNDGGVHHKVAAADWVGNTISAEDDKQTKVLMPVSTTATADLSAVMSMAYRNYIKSPIMADQTFAKQCLESSKKAWNFLVQHPDLIMTNPEYDGKLYGGPYSDDNDSDERLWAAVELYKSTGEAKYHDYIFQNMPKIFNKDRLGDKVPSWDNVNFMAVFSYLNHDRKDEGLASELLKHVTRYCDGILEDQKNNPFGISITGTTNKFDWGSNSVIATVGAHLLMASRLTNKEEYKIAAEKMAGYLFGQNPQNLSYITGISNNAAHSPHFRPSMSGKHKVPEGLLVGGANNKEYAGDLKGLALAHKPALQIYADHQDSWATNEVAINWQAALASFLGLLAAN